MVLIALPLYWFRQPQEDLSPGRYAQPLASDVCGDELYECRKQLKRARKKLKRTGSKREGGNSRKNSKRKGSNSRENSKREDDSSEDDK